MFSKTYTQWIAGATLALALATNLLGNGTASAQALTATLSASTTTPSAQSTPVGNTTVAAGTMLTVNGASYGYSEAVGLWINVPNGTAIAEDSLGQTDSHIVGTVIPLDAIEYTDAQGALIYNLNTSGLPGGNYSLVAQGLNTGIDGVLNFTIKAGPAFQITATSNTTVAAGTILTINGSPYMSNEVVGLWINVPNGTAIAETSLGQTDSHTVGTVIPLDTSGYADKDGMLTYNLDTTGLPSGSYSLVAQGLSTGLEGVLNFTIK